MPVVRAKEPFAYTDTNGVPRTVCTGDLFTDSDPCVKKRPHLFEAVEVAAARGASRATETASAAPGEVRAARSAPRKAAAKTPVKDGS